MAQCVESIRNEVGSGKLEVLQYHLFGLAVYMVQELLHVSLSPSHLNYESYKPKAEGVYVNKADVDVCGVCCQVYLALVFCPAPSRANKFKSLASPRSCYLSDNLGLRPDC